MRFLGTCIFDEFTTLFFKFQLVAVILVQF